MTDLHTRFRTLDKLSAPNLWPDIEERALAMQPTHRRRPWILVAATLLLALVIGGAALVGSGIIELPVPDGASPAPSAAASSSAPSSTPDQATEPSWTATGSMIETRAGYTATHTATPLLDGKVLVTGGYGPIPDAVLASAELYDPRTGSWTLTGTMTEARNGHTATLLPDGRVLVAGSSGGAGGTVASAELYDPSSGSWTPTGSMIEARAGHTATLLPDGRVLVAGGYSISISGGSGVGGTVASAELYDPVTGVWTPTGSMVEARAGHTATLLPDGRVLVAGGSSFGITIPGGVEPHPLASAELYDSGSGSWTPAGNMIEIRAGHAATLLPDGTVMVAGGGDEGGATLASAELYDPGSGSWTPTGNMIEARSGHTATLLPDGRVLVAGGSDSSGSGLASAELYDPSSGTWTATASMIEGRGGHTATPLPDGRVLVAGGYDSSGSAPASAELYDPGSGS